MPVGHDGHDHRQHVFHVDRAAPPYAAISDLSAEGVDRPFVAIGRDNVEVTVH